MLASCINFVKDCSLVVVTMHSDYNNYFRLQCFCLCLSTVLCNCAMRQSSFFFCFFVGRRAVDYLFTIRKVDASI